MKRVVVLLLLIISTIFWFSCGGNQKAGDDQIKNKALNKVTDTSFSQIVKLNNTLFSVPSPYQAAIFINEQNIPFNSEILSDVKRVKEFTASFKMAANLGVYGADLAYITLYEHSPEAMKYFSVIKLLSEKLELLAAFDKSTIERLEKNVSDQDSMLYILGNTYRNADAYLKENQREHIASAVIAGGWVESMYLLTHLGDASNESLKIRIGENKKPLENLIQLLAPYSESGEGFKGLVANLINLASIYENVSVTYEFISAKTNPETRVTVVNSKTSVSITSETMTEIKDAVAQTRSFIINQN
ncbi:MAG: hypothetical protein C0599_07900 [Salinivirgaceae bacterium]|nr:MAG: hypothetical protein C0599_07900 [Salinivirgaceae bacterium]